MVNVASVGGVLDVSYVSSEGKLSWDSADSIRMFLLCVNSNKFCSNLTVEQIALPSIWSQSAAAVDPAGARLRLVELFWSSISWTLFLTVILIHIPAFELLWFPSDTWDGAVEGKLWWRAWHHPAGVDHHFSLWNSQAVVVEWVKCTGGLYVGSRWFTSHWETIIIII